MGVTKHMVIKKEVIDSRTRVRVTSSRARFVLQVLYYTVVISKDYYKLEKLELNVVFIK